MVFRGKPSRGCESCRNLHVKCDEKRPECSRCARMNKACTGYRAQPDLMFCHENFSSTRRKQNKLKRNHEAENFELISRFQNQSIEPRFRVDRQNLIYGISRSLLPPEQDLVLCYFYETILETISEVDHSRELHMELPNIFSHSKPGSVLNLATLAISQAVWARSRPNDAFASSRSRKRYLQSLLALNAAIQDPVQVKSDETLYAVLLLSGYETIVFDVKAISAWATHNDGAAALLRVRWKQNLLTPLSRNMFFFIRRNIVQIRLQSAQPLDPMFTELAKSTSIYENVEDQLLSQIVHILDMQCIANALLSRSIRSIIKSDLRQLIQAAEKLDGKLADWASSVPPMWSFSSALNLSFSVPDTLNLSFVPSQIHRYTDFYIGRVWNMYRVSRLVLQSVLLRAVVRLSFMSNDDQALDYLRIEKTCSDLVMDICASVPFLLGYDLSELRRSTTSCPYNEMSIWPQNAMEKTKVSGHTGRFSLIWPLYIACSVQSIPDIQRKWLRAQLKWIAQLGEPQAKIALELESRMLTGETDIFRFDCT